LAGNPSHGEGITPAGKKRTFDKNGSTEMRETQRERERVVWTCMKTHGVNKRRKKKRGNQTAEK
jgi:hypothetical protein